MLSGSILALVQKNEAIQTECLRFFLKREYKWSFRSYKDGTDLSMNLQEVIDSIDELIRLDGEKVYCQFRF